MGGTAQSALMTALLMSLLPGGLAQVATSCNPLKSKDCPADPALGSVFDWDFRNGANDAFFTESYWLPFITYDPVGGATFTIPRQGVAPTLTTSFYIMFGKFEVTMKKAPGVGIISDVIMGSDDQDEIDLEWTSSNNAAVQSNYYSLRNGLTYAQGESYTSNAQMDSSFHTYSIDWNADRMIFGFDGNPFRTVSSAGNKQYPQTPMRISIGLWAGGDSKNAEGTIYWAGGRTDYSKAPFNMTVRSIRISDYSTGTSYSYGDQTGDWRSIRAQDGSINAQGTAAANSKTVSSYKMPASLVKSSSAAPSSAKSPLPAAPTIWPLPVSPNGHCGANANFSTCAGSQFGSCCSTYGFCGSSSDFCGDGCQQYYGKCGEAGALASLPSSTSTSTAIRAPTDLPITAQSVGGYCGISNGSTTCLGTPFGECCSQYGSCGSTKDFCGNGCQPSFGNCDGYPSKAFSSSSNSVITSGHRTSVTNAPTATGLSVTSVSLDGTCGSSNGTRTCVGSPFGDCCSEYGFCGLTNVHCGRGCQPSFGTCDSVSSSSSPSSLAQPLYSAVTSQSSSRASSTLANTTNVSPPTSSSGLSSLGSSAAAQASTGSSIHDVTSNSTTSQSSSLTIGSQSPSTMAQPPTTTDHSRTSLIDFGSCPPNSNAFYTALNSRVFTQPPCHTDFPFGDIGGLTKSVSALSACADQCATIDNCKQAVWNSRDGICWPKSTIASSRGNTGATDVTVINLASNYLSTQISDSTTKSPTSPVSSSQFVSTSSTRSSSPTTSCSTKSTPSVVIPAAISSPTTSAAAPQTSSQNPVCPSSNNTRYTSPSQQTWSILCDKDLQGPALSWSGGVNLVDCIGQCSKTNKCTATVWVSWFGFGACYFKTGDLDAGTLRAVDVPRVQAAYLVAKGASSSATATPSLLGFGSTKGRNFWRRGLHIVRGRGHGHAHAHAHAHR